MPLYKSLTIIWTSQSQKSTAKEYVTYYQEYHPNSLII